MSQVMRNRSVILSGRTRENYPSVMAYWSPKSDHRVWFSVCVWGDGVLCKPLLSI